MTSIRSSYDPQTATPVRIPADVEREDRVLANLTARQLAILTITGLVLYAAFTVTHTVLPLAVFTVLAVPVAVAAAIVTLRTRDGLSLDRLLVAALRLRLTPRVQVAAPGGITAAPAWITAHAQAAPDRAAGQASRGGAAGPVAPSVLHLPAEEVSDSVTGAGVIDLGPDGVAAVCVCSTVNFALRTPGEQEALVATFGRFLHSLTAPVQILIRAQRLDLSGQVAELRECAGGLPHPALEQAALEHADYLAQLAAQSDLLRRQVLLVLREPVHPAGAATLAGAGLLPRLPGTRRRAQAGAGEAARHAAEARLARRISEAVALLAAAGIVLTVLDAVQADAVLAGACNPDRLIPPTADLAAPDEIITTAASEEDTDASGWLPDRSNFSAAEDVGRDDGAGLDELCQKQLDADTAGDESWWVR
jgi:hypothetical protein